MIALHNVTFRWPAASENCLRNLTLTLDRGEWVALIGDNGAGKSTLLRLMAGLLTPQQGEVLLKEQPLSALNAPQRAAQIGVLFQEAENQILHSTVQREVAFGLKLQKLPAPVIEQRTRAALELCGLADVAQAHPLDLHAAQRRMVAVASLEALAPPVLLLDEPSRDFDERWLAVFEGWLAVCRQRQTTLLAISHDYDFTRRHFSRVIRLAAGKICADGLPAQRLS